MIFMKLSDIVRIEDGFLCLHNSIFWVVDIIGIVMLVVPIWANAPAFFIPWFGIRLVKRIWGISKIGGLLGFLTRE